VPGARRVHVLLDGVPADDGPPLVAEAHDASSRLVGAVTFNNATKLIGHRRPLTAEAVAA